MSTALYRRYRPDTFAHVIGQQHVTAPLMAALRAGRINHAYLFSGPRGCGKTTSARIMARCLNCAAGPTDVPCGECDSCRELATGGPGSLDVVEIDAASHNGVEDARELRERATFAPVRDRFKIFILDEAHMVTTAGFNALLKIVEEPPEHVLFIFATTEPEKVIGTIRSRTHHYPFRLVAPDTMVPYLQHLCDEESVTLESGVAQLIVRAGGGSVRDSLSVLDQLIAGADDATVTYQRAVALLGYTDEAVLLRAVDAVAGSDARSLFGLIEQSIASGHDPRRFVEDFLQRLRDLIVVAMAGDEARAVLQSIPDDQFERMLVQARTMGAPALTRAADLANQALSAMVGATSPRLHLEILAAKLLLPAQVQSAAPARKQGEPAENPEAGADDAAAQVTSAQQARTYLAQRRAARAAEQHTPRPAQAAPEGAGPVSWSASAANQASAPNQGEPERPSPAGAAAAAADSATSQATDAEVAAAHGAEKPVGEPEGTPSVSLDVPQATEEDAHPGGEAAPERAAQEMPEPTEAPMASAGEDPRPQAMGHREDSATGMQPAEMVRDRWDEVMACLQRLNRVTWMRVSSTAQVGPVRETTLSLLFQSHGAAEQFGRGPHPARVARAIYDTLGLKLEVRGDVGQADTNAVSEPGLTRGAPQPSDQGTPQDASAAAAQGISDRGHDDQPVPTPFDDDAPEPEDLGASDAPAPQHASGQAECAIGDTEWPAPAAEPDAPAPNDPPVAAGPPAASAPSTAWPTPAAIPADEPTPPEGSAGEGAGSMPVQPQVGPATQASAEGSPLSESPQSTARRGLYAVPSPRDDSPADADDADQWILDEADTTGADEEEIDIADTIPMDEDPRSRATGVDVLRDVLGATVIDESPLSPDGSPGGGR